MRAERRPNSACVWERALWQRALWERALWERALPANSAPNPARGPGDGCADTPQVHPCRLGCRRPGGRRSANPSPGPRASAKCHYEARCELPREPSDTRGSSMRLFHGIAPHCAWALSGPCRRGPSAAGTAAAEPPWMGHGVSSTARPAQSPTPATHDVTKASHP